MNSVRQTTVLPRIRDRLLLCRADTPRVEDNGNLTEFVFLTLTRFFAQELMDLEYDEAHPDCTPMCILKRGEPVDLYGMIHCVLSDEEDADPSACVDVPFITERLKRKGLLGSVQKNGLVFAPKCTVSDLCNEPLNRISAVIAEASREAEAGGGDLTDLKRTLVPYLFFDMGADVIDAAKEDPALVDAVINGEIFSSVHTFAGSA